MSLLLTVESISSLMAMFWVFGVGNIQTQEPSQDAWVCWVFKNILANKAGITASGVSKDNFVPTLGNKIVSVSNKGITTNMHNIKWSPETGNVTVQ